MVPNQPVEDNFKEFQKGMHAKMDNLGLRGADVVKREAGLFARTMIQLAGPKSYAKAREKIDSRIAGKFSTVDTAVSTEKQGSGNAVWLGASAQSLYGVPAEYDFRDSGADDLYHALFYKRTGKSTKSYRGRQTVILMRRILAKSSAVNRLKNRLKGHLGRLKASFAVSWINAGSPPGSLGPVPQWVLRHVDSSRQVGAGESIDQTNVRGNPSFTVISHARGASHISNAVINSALQIRIKAMATDLALYIRGVKK